MRSEKAAGGCGTFGYYMKNIIKFLLSHIGLVSLVVGYTIIGAFTFKELEAEHELDVKRNVTATRLKITDDLWAMTESSLYFQEHLWTEKVRERLLLFERELIRAMKTEGWDGIESTATKQWTFSGALFYSIILITTIGYGHIAPKTTWGKVATIFYAIPGVPLMMLCLANIGDGMAQSFRFLYWKICCYACTRKPKRKKRSTSRINRSRYPSSTGPSGPGTPRARASSFRRSTRASERSAESHLSDSAFYPNYDPEFRVNDDIHNKSKGNPTPRSSQHSSKSGDHLNIPNNQERDTQVPEERKASVLFNKYALDKEGIVQDGDIALVHLQRGKASTAEKPTILKQEQLETELEIDRQRERNREPEILVTRASGSRGPLGPPGYPKELGVNSQRDSGYYSSRHIPPNDPRIRLSRLDEEYYYDEYYDEDEDDDDDDDNDPANKPVPIWLGVMLVVVYIFGGAFLFHKWEEESNWTFLDSVYFCFITLTTIGFGDFVPAQTGKENAEMSIALCSIYLLFGIALLAMSFNLVQEEVINNVKKIAKRLGILKEEEEGEEEED